MHRITLLQLNDLHGYGSPHAESFDLTHAEHLAEGGGLGRIAGLLHTVRRDRDDAVVALDSGDTFHGTMEAVHTQGQALLQPMAALGLDAMTIHWELAYGLQRVQKMSGELPYPMLAANISSNGSCLFPPFTVVRRGGVRVGVIGLAAVAARHLVAAEGHSDVRITVGDDLVAEHIRTLRTAYGANLIVVLSHLGFPQDHKLATTVPGIDVIVSGHTHNRLTSPVIADGTVIIQSGSHGAFVGRLDVSLTRSGIAEVNHSLLPVDASWAVDEVVAERVADAMSPFAAARDNVLGESDVVLHRYAMLETTMDNLLLDAVAEAAGTEVSVSNGWRYGAPLAAGPLTEYDVWNIVPANPPVSVVRMTVGQLRSLFEDNLEATFAADPWQQQGGYVKRSRGLEMVAKIENPPGHRIQQFSAAGLQRDDHLLEVAFLGEQAVPRGCGEGRQGVGVSAVEALTSYLRRHKSVSPILRGAIGLA